MTPTPAPRPERAGDNTMRAVIHLNDYDPEDGQQDDGPYDPHHDPRSVVNGIETEWYEGSGNIHVTDDRVEQVAELVDGSVSIIRSGEMERNRAIPNAELVTIYPNIDGGGTTEALRDALRALVAIERDRQFGYRDGELHRDPTQVLAEALDALETADGDPGEIVPPVDQEKLGL